MATLDLIWPSEGNYRLWAWDMDPTIHQTVRPVRAFHMRVHLANIGFVGRCAHSSVIIKTARGDREIEKMDWEYRLYTNELKHLQGDVIPKCYGYFRGKVHGIEMGCLLLEFCSGPPATDLSEYNRQVMLAVCKVHQAGVSHGDLLDEHHVIRMGKSVRIIDFSFATRHICRNGVPVLVDSSSLNGQASCSELLNMEMTHGFSGDRFPSMTVNSSNLVNTFVRRET